MRYAKIYFPTLFNVSKTKYPYLRNLTLVLGCLTLYFIVFTMFVYYIYLR